MPNNYLMNGDTVSIVPEGALQVTQKLPAGIYTIEVSPPRPPMLRRIHDMVVPKHLYGDIEENTRKILTTFRDRTHSTGVLLAGTKGAGKTLLARNIATKLYENGTPTIIVPFNLICPLVAEFIDSIDTECMVLFDEIDKISGENDEEIRANSNCLLGLFDGISVHKRLYMLTANDIEKINNQLLNRPGRIYYRLMFGGVTQDAIKEYCNVNLHNKNHIDKMLHIATLIRDFSFDIMQAIVEECNRYNITPKEACDMLNVAPELKGDFKVQVFNKITGEEYAIHEYSKYVYMEFDDPQNTTEVRFYDPSKIQDIMDNIADKTERAKFKKRIASDPDFAKHQSQRYVYITDIAFSKIDKGSIIYEQDSLIIKCTPTARSHAYLAF